MKAIIAAMDRNQLIGVDGRLPWHFPTDLAYFESVTAGATVIMGRRTYELDAQGPLKGRRNIVVTSKSSYQAIGCETACSLAAALTMASEDAKVFIVGGSRLYQEGLKLVDYLFVTLIDKAFAGDTYFPEIDWSRFEVISRREVIEKGVRLTFLQARRRN